MRDPAQRSWLMFITDNRAAAVDRRMIVQRIKEAFPNAAKLIGSYSGGDDSGGWNGWTVVEADGLTGAVAIDDRLAVPGLTREPYAWERDENRSPIPAGTRIPVTFVEALESAFEDAHGYGSFAGEFHVDGAITIDLANLTIENHGSVSHESWSEF